MSPQPSARRATTAAPTFFPPATVTSLDGTVRHFVERVGSSYVRFQPGVPPGLGHMDDTSETSVRGLVGLAQGYCTSQSAELDQTAIMLEACRS